jgi:hypothetical protein
MRRTLAGQGRWGDRGRDVLVAALVLLPGGFAPWLGIWTLGVSALLLVVVVARRATRSGSGWWTALGGGAALFGGAVAVSSAAQAISQVGSVAPYDSRVGFGWLALILGVIAAAAGAIPSRSRAAAILIMLLAGLVGALAINLFFINTWYLAALPLWILSAVLSTTSGSHARLNLR